MAVGKQYVGGRHLVHIHILGQRVAADEGVDQQIMACGVQADATVSVVGDAHGVAVGLCVGSTLRPTVQSTDKALILWC